ncbi:hypothetical protein GCM10017786_41960 [Amycolatopsis deserti]|uniref:Uncharacterized protein n=1 Tax=Amycolatopsis deserti TaxID=185696 RepID=A0ABQ3J8E7_9PSEU|nr:hypothetical protein [Amycolatopsis deserti]GHF03775.1 hypothetical protein GCM10017786_41960 [Amycolatopsis deserti]
MTEPGDADSYVSIVEPEMDNGRAVLRFVTTSARDAAAIVAYWCKIGYVYTADFADESVIINFGRVTRAHTHQGSRFRGVGLPTAAWSVKPSAADIARARAALARQGEL